MAKSMYEYETLVKSWKTSRKWLDRKPGGNIEIFQNETENHSYLTPPPSCPPTRQHHLKHHVWLFQSV